MAGLMSGRDGALPPLIAALLVGCGAALAWWGVRPGLIRALRGGWSAASADRAPRSERGYRFLRTAVAAVLAWAGIAGGLLGSLNNDPAPAWANAVWVGGFALLGAGYLSVGLLATRWRRAEYRERAAQRVELGLSPGTYRRTPTHVAWLWAAIIIGFWPVEVALERSILMNLRHDPGVTDPTGTFTGTGTIIIWSITAYALLAAITTRLIYRRQNDRVLNQERILRLEQDHYLSDPRNQAGAS